MAEGAGFEREAVELFSVDMRVHNTRQYDTADGQRFLVNRNLSTGVRTPLTVLQNWADDS